MTLSQTNACQRLSAIGLRQSQVHQIIDLVSHWIRNNGSEWTVSRLKDYKQLYIHGKLAEKEYHPDSWISMGKDGRPKGPLGILWKGSSYKDKVKALNSLMVYSSLVSSQVTDRQRKKFEESVESPDPYTELQVRLLNGEIESFARRFKKPAAHEAIEFNEMVLSPTRRAPGNGTRTYQEDEVLDWWDEACDTTLIRTVMHRYPELMAPTTSALIRTVTSKVPGFDKIGFRCVGKIGFIQEPGFKLRAVANPNRLVQLALTPLQRAIWNFLRVIPNDCTFDQEKGVQRVYDCLVDGKVCHSIDLSDATNAFPLIVQMSLLRHMMPSQWHSSLDYFEHCSKSSWLYKESDGSYRKMHWTKGQPLGLAPSFGAFALAHHLVATRACRLAGVNPSESYVLLGDDIVLFDDQAAQHYRAILKGLGCKVSEGKTITSEKVAEFAGKVITPSGVIPTHKWRQVSDRNFIDVLKAIGQQFMGALRPRQRRVASLIAGIPEWEGGLGFNPKGLPLIERLDASRNVLRRLDSHDSGTPVTRANSSYMKLLLTKGLTTSLSLKDRLMGGASVGTKREEGFRPGSRASTSDRLQGLFEFLDMSIRDDDSLPIGYVPLVRDSDPRGNTALNILERKLEGIEDNAQTGYHSKM